MTTDENLTPKALAVLDLHPGSILPPLLLLGYLIVTGECGLRKELKVEEVIEAWEFNSRSGEVTRVHVWAACTVIREDVHGVIEALEDSPTFTIEAIDELYNLPDRTILSLFSLAQSVNSIRSQGLPQDIPQILLAHSPKQNSQGSEPLNQDESWAGIGITQEMLELACAFDRAAILLKKSDLEAEQGWKEELWSMDWKLDTGSSVSTSPPEILSRKSASRKRKREEVSQEDQETGDNLQAFEISQMDPSLFFVHIVSQKSIPRLVSSTDGRVDRKRARTLR